MDVRRHAMGGEAAGLGAAPRGAATPWSGCRGPRKVLLLGGYGYDSAVGYYPAVYRHRPLEAWTYDAAGDRWEFIASWSKDCPAARPPHAAAGGGRGGRPGGRGRRPGPGCAGGCGHAGRGRSEGPGGQAGHGGTPPRDWCDPEWYRKAPPADAAKTAAELAALPANTWVMQARRVDRATMWTGARRSTPPDLDLILRFSGGHCAYSGTAPQVYDVKTDRWSIPFAPEMPLEFCSSNELVPGEWSFSGSPWMSGHTYKTHRLRAGVEDAGLRRPRLRVLLRSCPRAAGRGPPSAAPSARTCT